MQAIYDRNQPLSSFPYNSHNLPSGSYVYRLQVGQEVAARTMTPVK